MCVENQLRDRELPSTVEEFTPICAGSKDERVWTKEEVTAAAEKEKIFIIEGGVYKLPAKWEHPGGDILLQDGRGHDVTIPFLTNHRPEVVQPLLKRWRVGRMDEVYDREHVSDMEREYVQIVKKVQTDPAWFEADYAFFAKKVVWYLALLFGSIGCALYGQTTLVRVVVAAILMGFFFQQVAFFGHDLGHNGITHDRKTDQLLGFLFGNALTGISVGWWKATHNVHHLVTNSLEYDCDIQHMPVFAVSKEQFKGIFSKYHMRDFPLDGVAQVLLRFQHFLYYPIMAVARVNLYIQSFILLKSEKHYRTYGGNSRMLEFAALGFFWTWFTALLRSFPTTQEALGFFFLSHAIAGLLHVQITISHFPMPVIEGNPLESGLNFVEMQLQGSIDVDCPEYMDWFHGGLQFQATHHICPRVPRHNLRRFREEIIRPFCKKHNVEYKIDSFWGCNARVFNTLKNASGSLHEFIWDGIACNG